MFDIFYFLVSYSAIQKVQVTTEGQTGEV